MQTKVIAAIAAALTFVAITPVEARRYDYRHEQARSQDDDDRPRLRRSHRDVGSRQAGRNRGVGERPGAWCGWFMRTRHGGGAEFNLAANWRRWGRPGSPRVGAIVVWPHHVGEIVGRSDGQWIVLSGNDGGRVRSRPRDISRAVVRI